MEEKSGLEQLHEAYKASFPEKKAEFESALSVFAATPDDQMAIEALRRLAHKLSGSAGAYGFEEIYKLSANVQALSDEQLGNPVHTQECIAAINALTQALGSQN